MTDSKEQHKPKHPKHEPAPEENAPQPADNQAPAGPTDGAAPESSAASEAAQEPMVGLTMAEYTSLQTKVEEADKKSRDYFEGWQRERADFLNYRKRIERENAQLHQNTSAQILKKYLVIIDDLERALKTRPTQGEGAAWAEGVELVYRKLANILDAEGLKPIAKAGDAFDPNLHEAISHEDSPDFQSGQLIEVLQQGYTVGEKVLRPALVRVAR
jgi:molecular chaperone GrpE